jgi:hypothetical protein
MKLKHCTCSLFLRDYVRLNTDVELGYNDIGLGDTSSITSDDLWY